MRSFLHSLGYRFRLHDKSLPGVPDIILRRHRKIIFVHGCFWHMHHCRYGSVVPRTNARFWLNKRLDTQSRDKRNLTALRRRGWSVFVVWECWLRDTVRMQRRISNFIGR